MATISDQFEHWKRHSDGPSDVGSQAILAVNESDRSGGYKNRSSSLFMWQRIAAGEIGGDELWFVQQVARKIVAIENSGLSPAERVKALGGATGLLGTIDRHREARRHAEALLDFWDLAELEPGDTVLKRLREYLKEHPEHWPDRDHEPSDSDFTELARSVLKSFRRKK